MNAGGAETFLMKVYRSLDKSQYQMDFCVNVQQEGFYDREIISLGGKIYHIPTKSENVKEFSRQLYNIIYTNGYKNVLRITSNAMGFYDLHIAKKAGATNCLARSSNSSDGGGIKPYIAHRVGKLLYKKDVDVEIAPSDLAAIYTFGRGDFESGKVKIVHNGINIEEFRFSEDKRMRIRNELGIENNCIVLGHIGRFSAQKNHDFLIDVFSYVHMIKPNTKLLLIGNGELQNRVHDKCKELQLEDVVIFTGVRKDVPDILSALDLLLFPSLYEGMPNVVIEAQASGLRCFISDRITKQVNVTGLVEQISIKTNLDWNSKIINFIDSFDDVQSIIDRKKMELPSSYDIKESTKQLLSYLV